MARIVGLLFSGAAARLAGAVAAIWVAHLAVGSLTSSLNAVSAALNVIQ